ncbi:MAG: TIGR00282 family metallophosphoesterase [Melioribacteraceae bacterium]|nr:TIGR00282 family metallophosphoesterase [Melioribacteraceae bacterium]MCF8354649.1 TIGR00282 family metallophosphoesterase [Melioribacteraceae bacterium]MCF8394176.1 TIGR00282 family metallophosphoesterase [Melioribacteraceae bacterium]MCF8418859.1 TIGR00282 family metallophosphoesterase [Melioribacteraceae bacterium]
MHINILFIGDIVGKPGLEIVQTWLPSIEKKYNADIVIANGENASDGKGCTEKEGKILFDLGIKVLTGGNHTWDKHQAQDYLRSEPRVLRPQNYPKGTYGGGVYVADSKKGKVGVINLQGRAFMAPIDCPFRTAEWALKKIGSDTKVILVDFHAEATAEKLSLVNFLDGKISILIGTHTHIQTADERIFPKGTGYITDVGMTGPYDSVIGMKTDAAVNRFLFQTPQKYQPATDNVHLSAVFAKIDIDTGKTVEIERIFFPDFEKKES